MSGPSRSPQRRGPSLWGLRSEWMVVKMRKKRASLAVRRGCGERWLCWAEMEAGRRRRGDQDRTAEGGGVYDVCLACWKHGGRGQPPGTYFLLLVIFCERPSTFLDGVFLICRRHAVLSHTTLLLSTREGALIENAHLSARVSSSRSHRKSEKSHCKSARPMVTLTRPCILAFPNRVG